MPRRRREAAASLPQDSAALEDESRDCGYTIDRSKNTEASAANSSTNAASAAAPDDGEFRGLLVLLCGIPGCGKDLIGRMCLQQYPTGAALSQDEHRGCAASAQAATEVLLQKGRSPLFILRNGVDASDRLPYVIAARRHSYRVCAFWPTELSNGDPHGKTALYLASVAGCYGRLTDGGRVGHETLTISSQPARVCLSFLRSFRAPSAPGEVDCIACIPFLMDSDWPCHMEDWAAEGSDSKDAAIASIASKISRGVLPHAVASLLCHGFEEVQARLQPFTTMRRQSTELSANLAQQVTLCLQEKGSKSPQPACALPANVPNRKETQQLQRVVKVRAAVEHLLSPSNIKACRATGSTVTNCVWLPAIDGHSQHRPAWPVSHFCGSPLLRRLCVSDDEVIAAAHASATAGAPLQLGDDGVCVEVLSSSEAGSHTRNYTVLISSLEPFPEASLRKLGCAAFTGAD